LGQVRDLTRIKGWCEAGEYSGTQGSNNFVRRTVTSQHNALDPRSDGTHLFKQRQVFLDSTVGISDDNTERPHTQPL
jgi:hypothetical protein